MSATFKHADFKRIWEEITEEQRKRLRAKANWEHMSLSAVMLDWPDLIAPYVLPLR